MKKSKYFWTILGILLLGVLVWASPVNPFKSLKEDSDLRILNNTVMLVNSASGAGGSGTVITSSPTESWILTNEHVCELVTKRRSFAKHQSKEYLIEAYVKYPDHDLCLVMVKEDLKIHTKISSEPPKFGERIRISGHPKLAPRTISTGHISDKLLITLISRVEECTEEQMKSNIWCTFFGVIPVIRTYSSLGTSAYVAPGSSGSAVYNSRDEIVAVVFAGRGRDLSTGILVPWEYVYDFVHIAKKERVVINQEKTLELEPSQNNSKKSTPLRTQDSSKLPVSAVVDFNLDTVLEVITESCLEDLEKCFSR